MKRKLALLLMGTLTAMSLVACGGETTEVPVEDTVVVETEAEVEVGVTDEETPEAETENSDAVVDETEVETEVADEETPETEVTDEETTEAETENSDVVASDDEAVDGGYTDAQIAFIDDFATLIHTYNELVDAINANEEWSNDEAIATSLDEVTTAMDELFMLCEDPSNLTDEAMTEIRTSFTDVYDLIHEIHDATVG